MNIMLIGGAGSFIDNIINKLNKEGHRIYLLTGNRYKQQAYQKVFERYDFTYDAECLKDIFESCSPDVIVFMGAYDTNFDWTEEEKTSIRFSNAITNILMSFVTAHLGRFIFLSSEEVYGENYSEDIIESAKTSPRTMKGLSLAQGEELCRMYREGRKLDIITVRLDHYYSIPQKRADIQNKVAKSCLELLELNEVTYIKNNIYSLLYETDAVEAIYQLIKTKDHRHEVYNISSSEATSDEKILEIIEKAAGEKIRKRELALPERRCILSSGLFNSEFGKPLVCNSESIIKKIYEKIFDNRYLFLMGEKVKKSFREQMIEKSGWFIKLLIPFAENLICFFIFFFLNYFCGDFKYFEKLDLFLIYVLLFAVIYGQQQAVCSSLLATTGYFIKNALKNPDQNLLFDLNTYVWVAQLFFVGLIVGYLKDQIVIFKNESKEEQEFLSTQLTDIQDINSSNVRVKGALETQLVNQNDSIGKIYRITSELDRYSPQEVLFNAAEVIAKLMKAEDVAIYSISEGPFARLFSSTSSKAKSMGNSIVYADMGELYETVVNHKVYINRKLDARYPLMANAIFSEDHIQVLVFVWGIPWERMTLGQANQFTVVCALIQEAVVRSNRYLTALEKERYFKDSRLLYPKAMSVLIKSYLDAEKKGLADCTVLQIDSADDEPIEAGLKLAEKIRQSDYPGLLEDGKLYILLSNTSKKESLFAIRRIEQIGYSSAIAEEFEI